MIQNIATYMYNYVAKVYITLNCICIQVAKSI